MEIRLFGMFESNRNQGNRKNDFLTIKGLQTFVGLPFLFYYDNIEKQVTLIM